MLNKLRYYLKRRGLKVRDIIPIPLIDTVSETTDGSNAGLSLFSWILIAVVGVGVIYAIVKIVKVSKKKKLAQA